MTLQQKLLAKQSKKGFTLVELVVVIAILAILAAIAIPAVVNIINSANTASSQTNAANIDSACKNFYSGVVSGTVNASTDSDISGLPDADAPANKKKSSAKEMDVEAALTWNGIIDQFKTAEGEDGLGDYQYSTDGIGTVTYVGDDGEVDDGNAQLKLGIKFKDMYTKVAGGD